MGGGAVADAHHHSAREQRLVYTVKSNRQLDRDADIRAIGGCRGLLVQSIDALAEHAPPCRARSRLTDFNQQRQMHVNSYALGRWGLA